MRKWLVNCDKFYTCAVAAFHLGDSTRKREKLQYSSPPLTQTDWVGARNQQEQRTGRCGHAFGVCVSELGRQALWPSRLILYFLPQLGSGENQGGHEVPPREGPPSQAILRFYPIYSSHLSLQHWGDM